MAIGLLDLPREIISKILRLLDPGSVAKLFSINLEFQRYAVLITDEEHRIPHFKNYSKTHLLTNTNAKYIERELISVFEISHFNQLDQEMFLSEYYNINKIIVINYNSAVDSEDDLFVSIRDYICGFSGLNTCFVINVDPMFHGSFDKERLQLHTYSAQCLLVNITHNVSQYAERTYMIEIEKTQNLIDDIQLISAPSEKLVNMMHLTSLTLAVTADLMLEDLSFPSLTELSINLYNAHLAIHNIEAVKLESFYVSYHSFVYPLFTDGMLKVGDSFSKLSIAKPRDYFTYEKKDAILWDHDYHFDLFNKAKVLYVYGIGSKLFTDSMFLTLEKLETLRFHALEVHHLDLSKFDLKSLKNLEVKIYLMNFQLFEFQLVLRQAPNIRRLTIGGENITTYDTRYILLTNFSEIELSKLEYLKLEYIRTNLKSLTLPKLREMSLYSVLNPPNHKGLTSLLRRFLLPNDGSQADLSLDCTTTPRLERLDISYPESSNGSRVELRNRDRLTEITHEYCSIADV